eukprot:g12463.t1
MARRGKASKAKRSQPKQSATPVDPPKSKSKRYITQGLALLAVVALVATIIVTSLSPDDIGSRTLDTGQGGPQLVEVDFQGDRSTWELLALSDEALEKVSLVELNLAVLREIEGYEDLDASQYEAIVDQWSKEFAKELPKIDATFRGREAEYKNDLRFYRIGQLMAWLGHKKNIAYIPEQRDLDHVVYKDPGELFLHGLLDTRLGTCGNMPTLQAAIARRMGWPVALAPVESHTVCRFDDGEVAYNIETTHADKGGFSAGSEADYAKAFKLPPCAFTEADTLETMSAREMLAYFISLRGRYYWDTGQWEKADQDHSLARSLLPRHRRLLLASMELSIQRSNQIFNTHEERHPFALYAQARSAHEKRQAKRSDPFNVDRINAENRRRIQEEHARVMAISEQNHRRWENPAGYQHQHPQHWNQTSGYQPPQTHDPFSTFPPQPID